MSGKKILLIDDDKAIHAVVRAALGRAGHRVFTAVDAMQGPMFARQVEPDLVILDINLPGGGGEKVFDRLRSLPATAGLPILIYSAVARSDFVSTIEETQDTVFLAKPATPEAIVAAVERLLGAG